MIAFPDDEAFAAEYALGTLDLDERNAAGARRESDRAFDALVRGWEQRLAPLVTAGPDIPPPPEVFQRVLAEIGPAIRVPQPARPAEPSLRDNVVAMHRQLRFWRGTAAIATALAAMLAIWVAQREVTGLGAPQTYVAVLQQGNGEPTFVVSLDLASKRMSVRPVGTTAPPDKSYELWMIGGDAKPRAMGVMDSDAPLKPTLPDVDNGVLSGATYAITLEPRGGSPTGQPTSTPLFVGKMVDTAL